MPASGTVKGTILLVESDEPVRTLIRSLLSTGGFRVIEARTEAEALEFACAPDRKVDLLISDLLLPGASGVDLLGRLRTHLPAVKALFLTGYVDDGVLQGGFEELGAGCLEMPFQPSALLRKVREALEARPISPAD